MQVRVREKCTLAAATIIGAGSALGDNEIRTEVHDSGGTTIQDFDAGAAITLTVDNTATLVNIYDKDLGTVDDIGRVTINGTDTNLKVKIGDGVFPLFGQDMVLGGDDFDGLTFGSSTTRLASQFAGRIAGNLTDSVSVGFFYRFDVEGEIQAEIRAKTQGGFELFRVFAGGISSAGSIVCTGEGIGNGRINRVTVTDGDIAGPITSDGNGGRIDVVEIIGTTGGNLLANVSAINGEVKRIEINGNIGTAANTVTITAGKDLDSGFGGDFSGIKRIEADAIWADIETNRIGRGDLEEFLVHVGDFVGELLTESIQGHDPSIDVAGDIDADIIMGGIPKNPIDIGGKLAANKIISIKERLDDLADITITDTAGLDGIIIINGADAGHIWESGATITIGTTTLGPIPYYDEVAADVGLGAVGLAPFGFHKTDSEPDWDSTVTTAVPKEVSIVHYGPVHSGGLGSIVTVEWATLTGNTWTDVSGDFLVDASSSPVGFRRDIVVKPKLGKAFVDKRKYRIKPSVGRVLCCHVDGCPQVSWQETYFQFAIDLQ